MGNQETSLSPPFPGGSWAKRACPAAGILWVEFSRFPTKMDDADTLSDLDSEYDLLEGYIEPNDLDFDLSNDLLSEPDTVVQFPPLLDEVSGLEED